MAEVIGLIASLVTMATLVNDGVKRAKLLYQAADELETMQASAILAAEIDHCCCSQRPSPMLTPVL